VCGEHGGDPRSITFFHDLASRGAKIDHVSCSPFRVVVARVAAAQAACREMTETTTDGDEKNKK
jgi:pyruvate,orthophosphate dikinase